MSNEASAPHRLHSDVQFAEIVDHIRYALDWLDECKLSQFEVTQQVRELRDRYGDEAVDAAEARKS